MPRSLNLPKQLNVRFLAEADIFNRVVRQARLCCGARTKSDAKKPFGALEPAPKFFQKARNNFAARGLGRLG